MQTNEAKMKMSDIVKPWQNVGGTQLAWLGV